MATFDDDKNSIIGILQFTEMLLEHLISRLPADEQLRFSVSGAQGRLLTNSNAPIFLEEVAREGVHLERRFPFGQKSHAAR